MTSGKHSWLCWRNEWMYDTRGVAGRARCRDVTCRIQGAGAVGWSGVCARWRWFRIWWSQCGEARRARRRRRCRRCPAARRAGASAARPRCAPRASPPGPPASTWTRAPHAAAKTTRRVPAHRWPPETAVRPTNATDRFIKVWCGCPTVCIQRRRAAGTTHAATDGAASASETTVLTYGASQSGMGHIDSQFGRRQGAVVGPTRRCWMNNKTNKQTCLGCSFVLFAGGNYEENVGCMTHEKQN